MYKCAIQKQGENLAEPYRSEYFALVSKRYDDGGLTHTKLTNELLKAGLKASTGSIANHRNLACLCGGNK